MKMLTPPVVRARKRSKKIYDNKKHKLAPDAPTAVGTTKMSKRLPHRGTRGGRVYEGSTIIYIY